MEFLNVNFTDTNQLLNQEKRLEEKSSKLQSTVNSLQFSIGIQRSSLKKILWLLGLEPIEEDQILETEDYLERCLQDIESKIKGLHSSDDVEKVFDISSYYC